MSRKVVYERKNEIRILNNDNAAVSDDCTLNTLECYLFTKITVVNVVRILVKCERKCNFCALVCMCVLVRVHRAGYNVCMKKREANETDKTN